MVGGDHSQSCPGLGALDGMVAEVGVDLECVDAFDDGTTVDECGAEREGVPGAVRDQFRSIRAGLVIADHGAIPHNRQALAGRLITKSDAVTDDDPGVAETVVVAVDGKQGPDVFRDRCRVLDDVGSEAVLRKGAAQGGDVIQLYIGHIPGLGGIPGTRSVLGDGDLPITGSVGRAVDHPVPRRCGSGGGGAADLGSGQPLVVGCRGDVGVFYQVAVDGPGRTACCGEPSCPGGPGDDGSAGQAPGGS